MDPTKELVLTAEDWAIAISQRWQDTVATILDTGRLLIEAKGALNHGEFLSMTQSLSCLGKEPDARERTAQRLMSIASDSLLSNPTNLSVLPPVWTTLYELSRLPEPNIQTALSDGLIYPTMRGREVTELKRLASRVHSAPSPVSGKYRILYADPPWSYGNAGLDDYGHAERHYASMSIEALCKLGDEVVKPASEDNAVLFMWVTSPLLAECFEVIKAWGFAYKTSFVWDKVKHNFGHYNSVRHELLLVCTKGSCTPDVLTLHDSVVEVERSERHSEKPEEFRKIIDGLYPKGNRLELFARKSVEGWTPWGNETTALTTKVS